MSPLHRTQIPSCMGKAGDSPSIQYTIVACSANSSVTNKQTRKFFFSPLPSMEPLIVRPVRTLIRTRAEVFLLAWIDSVRVSAYSPSIHGMELHITSQILPSCTARLHIPADGMIQFAAASLARYPKKEIEINNKQCEFILAFGIDKPRPPNRLYLRTATKQEETERKRRGYHTTHLQ